MIAAPPQRGGDVAGSACNKGAGRRLGWLALAMHGRRAGEAEGGSTFQACFRDVSFDLQNIFLKIQLAFFLPPPTLVLYSGE